VWRNSAKVTPWYAEMAHKNKFFATNVNGGAFKKIYGVKVALLN